MEKTALLETVRNLHEEIGHLNEKLNMKQPTPNPTVIDDEECYEDIEIKVHDNLEITETTNNGTQEIETISGHDPCGEEISNVPVKLNKNIEMLDDPVEADLSDDNICPMCNFGFSTNENLRIHVNNVHLKLAESKMAQKYDPMIEHNLHPNLDTSEEMSGNDYKLNVSTGVTLPEQKGRGKSLKCDQCPYETSVTSQLRKHIDGVHEKIKSHFCKECGYATTRKTNLDYHMASVHNIGKKKFKCEQCSHRSIAKAHLRQHIKRVHETIKIKDCKDCGYSFHLESNFKKHNCREMRRIGGEKYKCKLCAYQSHKKDYLTMHMKYKHVK